MAGFNGSGTYVRNFSWVNDKTNGIDITASRFDTEDNGYATGLSTVICKDGQSTTTGRIPFAQGVSVSAGAANAPSIAIIGDSSTGFYQSAGGALSFSSLGTSKLTLNGTGIVLAGTASGTATIKVAATAGTVNFQLPTTNGTNGQLLQTDGSGNASWVTVGSGSGTVNSGTSGQLGYYASSTNAISGNANLNISAGALTLGVAASVIGQLKLAGNTSGTIIITPPAIAGTGTLTLPVATDTLTGKATTDTFTNKTLDTAGTGNVFKIAGTQISSISGNTSKLATTSGTLTSGHAAVFDASGNVVDGGSGALPAFGAVGAYIIATCVALVNAGSTTAGSNLTPSGMVSTGSVRGSGNPTPDAVTGTWRAMQSNQDTSSNSLAVLWLRTA